MKIAMIASEANPYIKTGGLADVVYSLSKEMVNLKEDVAIVIPLYNKVRQKLTKAKVVASITVNMSWRREIVNIYHEVKDGIKFYFLEDRLYFERDNIYGYDDDGERFALFALASIKALEAVKFSPDVIHVHDWQSAMVPCIIKETNNQFFNKTKFVLSIHNPAFQGILAREAIGDLFNLPLWLYDSGVLRFGDRVSTLKGGIMYADKIVTVSPSHAKELLTPEGGMGLNNVLIYREYDFCGFLNGIDYDEFNPLKDKHIVATYDENNFQEAKKQNKIALCKELGLKNPDAPLFTLVSRVTWQKGMGLVFHAVHDIVARGGNVVLLGSGEFAAECEMNNLHMKYPDQVAVYIGYNDALAHKIYAAGDFFLMPSLFEPCGLGQMIAQRYGNLPIVRRVGGLRDSVINFDGGNVETSNGFGFDEFSEYEISRTCIYALDIYNNQEVFLHLVRNALLTDNSWKKSGQEYHGLYLDIVKNR